MRIFSVITLVAGITAGVLFAPPPVHTQHCEIIGCYTAECWWVAPGHRRCRRVCHRRCWNDAPRYYAPPAPTYTPQYAYAPPYQYRGPQLDPALVGIGIIAVIVAIIAAIISAATSSSTPGDIQAIEESTRSMLAAASDDEARTHAIHEHVAAKERAAYEEGRRIADEEFYR